MPWRPETVHSERIAIHAALVRTATGAAIVYFDGEFADPGTRLCDVETLAISSVEPAPDKHIMCSGHAFLGDGRLLVGGGVHQQNVSHVGQHEHDSGERQCHIYSPFAGAWEPGDQPVAPFNFQPGSPDTGGGRWYPTLVTLQNGEVLAVAGHPFSGVCHERDEEGNCIDLDPAGADDYIFPGDDGPRHNNNTPERYSAAANKWTLLTAESTSHINQAQDEYPRVHLTPGGLVFFSTRAKEDRRFYDPFTGTYPAAYADVDPGDSFYHGSGGGNLRTAVMLPILHSDPDDVWVLMCGGGIDPDDPDTELGPPQRINIASNAPSWRGAGERQLANKPIRYNLCSVNLPNGDIFFTGGIGPNDAAVFIPEIYHPPIDWDNGTYISDSDGSWESLDDEPATVARGYHCVALLMPDGRIWTAGSTDPVNEYQIEIYEPSYIADDDRPTVSNVPKSASFGMNIRFTTQANSIQRVVFTRCGSVTHAFDADQRMVTAAFTAINATTLQVSIPGSWAMPPGRYMLWVIDTNDRVSQWAPFIRICGQKPLFSVDFDKFAKSEVDALGTPANFNNAVYLIYDGFLPDEVSTPSRSIVWKDTNEEVPGISTTLGPAKYEGGAENKDVSQRIVFPVHVRFDEDSAFDDIPDDPGFREIVLIATMGHYQTSVTLSLTRKLNPRMSDGDPHWLSVDLRAFSTRAGASPFTADIDNPASAAEATDYIQDVLSTYDSWDEDHPGESHPFDALPTDQETNRLPLYSHEGNDPVFNFAVARVRFRAPETDEATNVRVFFRLWTTGWSALTYLTDHDHGSYPREGNGASARALLGRYGGEVNTIPCFAEPREADMLDQEDATNLKTLSGVGAAEVHSYYGCWLDFNQDIARFPLEPAAGDPGPFGGNLNSIQELMRGLHQCLVAEIHYWPDDEISQGATPASSDNLAQRNLLFDDSDNPGGLAAHLVHHTFQMKPSPVPLPPIGVQPIPSSTAAGRLHPDELVIDWGNLPRDSYVTFYMPQVDVDAVLRFAASRGGPPVLAKADDHSIRCKVSDVGFIPLPGGISEPIAGLVSIQLPPTVSQGQKFRIVLRQVDGRKLRVIGTTQFDIYVKTGPQILPGWQRNLSVLKHIALSIPQTSRWYLIFQRYLEELGSRIRALGGNPDEIEPSPAGSGKADRPGPRPGSEPPTRTRTGKIRELVYDCFGDFEGFVLEDCERSFRFNACEKAMEEVVRRACRERLTVTVHFREREKRKPLKLIVHCC